MEQFDAIRPYRDDEVAGVIQQLLVDQEFLNLASSRQVPRLARFAPAVARALVSYWLKRKYGAINSIASLQSELAQFVEQLIQVSTSRVTQSGLEKLDPTKAYLFLSNHRDIVFDPMIVNYLLFQQGMETARIAIGDNLLQNHVFAELMRLNKSFLVRRNMTSAREMRDAFFTLSSFISHCIENRHSVWIAQREGRAKSGLDHTDPAIIKMFYMSRKKEPVPFSEAMNQLSIVPVSISYELDPCDGAKARELEIRERTGQYTKAPDEDTQQILLGLSGQKGHVHVHFGEVITDAPDQPVALAGQIDREINGNYMLHATNWAAYRLLNSATSAVPETMPIPLPTAERLNRATELLEQRFAAYDANLRPYLLTMYANPVAQALALYAEHRSA
ncbi:MAG: glycerol acyltransferase [Alteromonadaceae bacterium]|nr:glycerol acyltransferase [Alteromonadaceae bacterium]